MSQGGHCRGFRYSAPREVAWPLGHRCQGRPVPRTTSSCIRRPKFFIRTRAQYSWSENVWSLTPLLTPSDLRTLTATRKSWAVSGTTISFSPFIWALRPFGHRGRSQARKRRVSVTPVMKTSPISALTWRDRCSRPEVVSTGMPLRGIVMCLDMRLLAACGEAAESDESDSMSVVLSGPVCDRAARPIATAA
jgi:hypothetical protein